jgi:hypothetical protein
VNDELERMCKKVTVICVSVLTYHLQRGMRVIVV